MPTFTPPDNEFAASTGDNVNNNVGGAGTSQFDNPPNAFSDLVITSQAGDPDPYSFELGDTYSLTWGGHGGGGEIVDAVVIRSDSLPQGGHAVVFEGIDENGETAQIVWTPDHDLESWFWDHSTPSDDPGFYVYDTDPATEYTAQMICFDGETLIATPRGPVRAASLVPGMMVETLDHGPQMLLWVGQSVVRGSGRQAPVEFPVGALGNDRPLLLSPQHRVLHRSATAELLFAEPEVLVPARVYALAGQAGARSVERPMIRYVHLLFERHEIVMAEGAPCESLFLGDVARRALDADARDEIATHFPELDLDLPDGQPFEAARPVLRCYEARTLFQHLSGWAPEMPLAPAVAAQGV